MTGTPPPDDDPALEEVAERIADEASVDWDARTTQHPAAGSRLQKLRLLERLGRAFRSAGERVAGEPAAAGRRLGPYRTLSELGRGGMGVVYLAERVHGGFEQRVAIKLLKRGMDSDAILQRFLRERQILAGLEHPNVARLLDGGVSEDGLPYFAMELVDGSPLTRYCDERGLGVLGRLRLFEEACRAVQHAHAKLVVHRDLKPSNMLVTREGRLKLLDFGIAKLLATEDEATALTRDGMRLLTPEYAAPEQLRGERVTTATDVYALGVVLYELLAGTLPHDLAGRSTEEIVRAICETEPRRPSLAAAADPRRARRLTGDLDTVVLKALSKEPSRRYASAEALADDVGRHLAGRPVQARPDTLGYVAGKFVRRHKLGVSAAGVAALSLVLGLVAAAWQAAVAARERDHARAESARAESVKQFLVGLFKASDPAESKGETVTARELLDRGADRIEKELAGHPSLQAELFDVVAGISHEFGRYDRARQLAERSLERARQAYGPEHVQVAKAMHTLGWILHRSGDHAASEELRRQSLAMRRRLLPEDSLEVADSLDSLGLVLRARAKLQEAEAAHREALLIREKRLGLEHPDTADVLTNLADVLLAKGDFVAAAEEHRKVLQIRRKVLGDLHPSVAYSLISLGGALLQEGDRAGAEAAHREASSIRRRVYGEEHPLVSESLHHLAATLHSNGDLEGAETLYRQALAMDKKLKGEGHRDVAILLTNLGYALAQQARFGEALALFDQAAQLHRRVSGADHPLLARTLERKAAALVEQGRCREALPLLDESLRINKARYGAGHAVVAGGLASLARAKAGLQEWEDAERLFREALLIQRRTRPRPHIDTAEMLVGLGEVLSRLGRDAEAEPLLREALVQAQRSLPAGHWRRGEVESALGACLWRLGRRDEARPLLVSGHELLRKTQGAAHPATVRAERRLKLTRDG